ncbi:hypothetical protein [Maridesulfovibrio sp.]|uniref:hypothetical protein n=1 Tax=Maridesulfovibrio sp. TaxID=2795000 RepID=UPI0029CA527A|nr:hypothetical protein [Maridesulfovibrio sp.]
MKSRYLIISLLIVIVTAFPAFAHADCNDILKAELGNISGINAVVQNKSGFLAILDEMSRKQEVSVVSEINKLHKKDDGKCNFSSLPVAVMDSNLDELKSGSASSLSRSDLTKLLYEYVYKLSPIQVEQNLKGYEKLTELAPQNTYYKARKEHYTERSTLVKTRAKFIARCLKEFPKDKNILDLEIKRDFYLFVVAGETPLKTAEKFMDKIAQDTPRPDKKMCVIAYSADMENRQSSCPEEYEKLMTSNEEELLMRHVQSMPGYKIQLNINGYKALKKLNPSSTMYTDKLAAYEAKQQGLQRFLNLRTASGEKLISKSSNRGYTLYATLNNEALDGKSASTNRKLFHLLRDLYAIDGYAFKKCVLKNSADKTLGTISCGNSRCTFR